jgi:N-acetylmuramoyl-L-alanine amidase
MKLSRRSLTTIAVIIAVASAAGCGLLYRDGGEHRSSSAAREPTAASNPRHSGGGHGVLTGITVTVDPGHNGGNARAPRVINRLVDAGTLRKPCDTTGTATKGGYSEHAFTFDLAVRLRRDLAEQGARVVLTRNNDHGVGPCITTRAAIGNRANSTVAISLHADGNNRPGARGFDVIYPRSIRGLTQGIAGRSLRLARAIRASLVAAVAATGLTPSNYLAGVEPGLSERSDLGGLNLSHVPKVFVELGNMRNSADARLLESPHRRTAMAQALTNGIDAFVTSSGSRHR